MLLPCRMILTVYLMEFIIAKSIYGYGKFYMHLRFLIVEIASKVVQPLLALHVLGTLRVTKDTSLFCIYGETKISYLRWSLVELDCL